MKSIERSENEYILETLRQYLQQEGIKADIQREWKTGRMKGPFILVVEDNDYEDALRALANIDKYDVDDGIPLTTGSGKTYIEIRERYNSITKWLCRGLLILIIALALYAVIRY